MNAPTVAFSSILYLPDCLWHWKKVTSSLPAHWNIWRHHSASAVAAEPVLTVVYLQSRTPLVKCAEGELIDKEEISKDALVSNVRRTSYRFVPSVISEWWSTKVSWLLRTSHVPKLLLKRRSVQWRRKFCLNFTSEIYPESVTNFNKWQCTAYHKQN